jgi:hypothetical protein
VTAHPVSNPLPPAFDLAPSLTGPFQVEVAPKVSLHLDLLAQIQSLGEPSTLKKEAATKEATDEGKSSLEEQPHPDKLQGILQELMDIRKERDRLEKEIQRNNLELAEERASREFAEQKLESVKCDLLGVKETLKQRDRDSRGYFLMSQKSMDEICQAFGRLMYMLEETSRKTNDSLEMIDQEDDSSVRDDIRRRFALIIRKTKSENLKRGYFVDEHAVLSRLQMTSRYGRSESNVHTSIQPLVPMMRVERHIGDTAETIGLPDIMAHYQGQQHNHPRISRDGRESSSKKARAIFASIVNGDSSITFNSRTCDRT